MKLPRRNISASGRGRCRAADRLARRVGASLSGAAGALHRRLCRRWHGRHHRAPDRSMAVGAARPAIRHREPAGRRHQYRHRGGRESARRRLHAAPGRLQPTRSTRRSTTNSISISSATSRRSRASAACATCHGGQSIGSGQDGSRVHRLRQSQSGQDQHGVGRHRDRRAMWPASCSR